MVEEWSRKPDVDGVGKGKGKGCFVCGRPGHAAKDCKFNQAKGKKPRARASQRVPRLTRTVPAKFEGECRPCGKNGHKWAEAKDKKVHAVGGAPSTATVAAVEDTGEIDEAGICGEWSDDEDNRVNTVKTTPQKTSFRSVNLYKDFAYRSKME